MKINVLPVHVIAVFAAALIPGAHGATTFLDFDICVNPDSCTAYPNSHAKQTEFLSALINPEIEYFESFAVGDYTSLSINAFASAGAVDLTGTSFRIQTDTGPGQGRFPVSGTKFLEASAGSDFEINFATPVAAFGFYGIDLGDFGGAIVVKTTLNGGSEKSYPLTLTGLGNGDVLFFGLIDLDLFDKFVFDTTAGTSLDIFGFDDLTVASFEQIDVKTPKMFDDPHVLTWSHHMFDYMGQCDLVLVSAPDFTETQSLDLHVRTTVRYDYSFITSAALRIGDDVLEVGSFGDWTVNSVNRADLSSGGGLTIGGYPIHYTEISDKRTKFDVVIGKSENITLSTFKDMVSVAIQGPNIDHWAHSAGLMGSYFGKTLARDGKTVFEDMDAFGQEWQVTDTEEKLFRTARAPQYPEQCILPSPESQTKRRRLGDNGVSKDEAEKACAQKEGQLKQACIFDVLATNDVDVAGAV